MTSFPNHQSEESNALKLAKEYADLCGGISDPILKNALLYLSATALSDATIKFGKVMKNDPKETELCDVLYNARLIEDAHQKRPTGLNNVRSYLCFRSRRPFANRMVLSYRFPNLRLRRLQELLTIC
jgi:hypothetical protein